MATNYGLNDSLEYLEFEFDSYDSDQSVDGAYNPLNWPLFYLGRPLTNVAAIKILEVQIPFSYYVINAVNNTFVVYLTWGNYESTNYYTVTIPVGNYTSSSFSAAIATALNTATGYTWTVNYSNLTNTISYSVAEESLSQLLVIDSTNNTFIIKNFFASARGTIVPGTYTGTTLASAIQTSMGSLTLITGSSVGSLSTTLVSYSGSTNLFQFLNTNLVAGLDYNLTLNSNSLMQILGFTVLSNPFSTNANPYLLVSKVSLAPSIAFQFGTTSDNGINNPRFPMGFSAGETGGILNGSTITITSNNIAITGPPYIYINSSILGSQCKLYLPAQSIGNGTLGPQMCKVAVNSNPGGIIKWNDPDPFKWVNCIF